MVRTRYYISIKLTPFGNNVNNIFLKGVFDLIRMVLLCVVTEGNYSKLMADLKKKI